MILLFFLLIILLFYFYFNIKWTKQEIAESYGICKKTLAKWVEYCSPNIDYKIWKKRRKLSFSDVLFIYDEFGVPEENKALTKGEIKEKCETFYHTIKENVTLNFKKLGINKNAYLSVDIFPPKLSFKMIKLMGQ